MLIETHIDGYVRDKVAIAIDRLRAFEPEEGYYLAFSGGKDSQCIYHLAVEAGVKFDAHYNMTGIDAPELVTFIKQNYPDVSRDMYKKSMWRLIERNGPPTRLNRFCCKELKEHGGEGRICITGVRWAESVRRKNDRRVMEYMGKTKKAKILFDDNDKGRRLFESCQLKGKRVLNPIVDWEDEDVWEYLNSRKVEHCKLYEQGFHRLGCIGCPIAGTKGMLRDFKKYPKFYDNYKRAIERFLPAYFERCKAKEKEPFRKTAQEWMDWWIYDAETIDYTDSFLED
jgi:phosphoadenosine phosphosulfate reductase